MTTQPSAASTILVFLTSAAMACADPAGTAPGKFDSSWESLKKYQCPEWFRDAKFGIWSHWGPQAVPKQGDWYARNMYLEGNRQYQHHLQTYGHPSEHGYKEIIPMWKAEKWDPDRLMTLYKNAGAKYFVSMGCHHDNFDLWNSKYHKWNSVNMGPKRDIVGEWQQAAKKHGLRFGVSEHMAASFTWWQGNRGADKNGPKTGVPYDGIDAKFADLYHPGAAPDDKGWYSTNPEWHAKWSKRVHDLIETYQPDLLYSDGGLPFGVTGRQLLADFYSASAARNGGRTDVVYNCKSLHGNSENNQFVSESCVHDMERGVLDGIQPLPWQTDTSIGDWFYNEHWKYRPVSWTIHMLVDIVSKNGNLLLNVVQRPDGSLDPEVEQTLAELADWNAIHGEAIYGTRPWQVFGEGRMKAKGGNFNENFTYTASDIRFTTKGGKLYAIALGWPNDGKLLVRSLARPDGSDTNNLTKVSLLGHEGELKWRQTPEGLVVTLPEKKVSEHTTALRIEGTNLKAIPVAAMAVRADDKGNYQLGAGDAELHGTQIACESRGGGSSIGFWDRGNEWVSWNVNFDKPGTFEVVARVATENKGARFTVECDGQSLNGEPDATGSWEKFAPVSPGRIEIKKSGSQLVKVRATDANKWKALNLAGLELRRR